MRLQNGGRVLGLRVSAGEEGLQWRRDNLVENEYTLTKRGVFFLCSRLTGHHPVCGWLRPSASYLKRRVNELSNVWDEVIAEKSVSEMVTEVLGKVAADDPAKGRWDVQGDELTVWTDASSLALGVAIEVEGEIVEDGSWLRRDDGTHINVAELDAVLKGVNMAILWVAKKIHLMTDSQTALPLDSKHPQWQITTENKGSIGDAHPKATVDSTDAGGRVQTGNPCTACLLLTTAPTRSPGFHSDGCMQAENPRKCALPPGTLTNSSTHM